MPDLLPPDAPGPPPPSHLEEPDAPPVAVLPAVTSGPASERRALGVLAVAAVAAMIWVCHPVAIGILLGALNAFTMQPFYERLRARYKRSTLAAGLSIAASSAILLGALAGLSYLLIGRGIVLVSNLITDLGPGGPARNVVLGWTRRLDPLGVHTSDLLAKLRDAATTLATRAAATAAAIASATFSGLLALFFVLMTTYFVLRHWSALTRRAEDMLPLNPRHTRALLDEFRVLGRTTLLGTVLTGLAQGVLAGIGYWITGLPEPAFFGAATAAASLIPAVGTLLIWVPAGIYLILDHHVGLGILELVWGTLVVVGVSDYIIRPRLVGGHGSMPELLTFAALFGGVEAFGLVGLLLGPLIMGVAVATLRIYAAETVKLRAPRPDTEHRAV
jgi:predicted PurR-regulated permease PerM